MRIGSRNSSCIVALFLPAILLVSVHVHGYSSTVVGINGSHKVHIQEYWFGNEPFYCISNLNDTSVTVTVHPYKETREKTSVLATWQIEGKAIREVNVFYLLGHHDLFEFRIGETSLGLLFAPKSPEQPVDDSAFVMFKGLNEYGGTPFKVWTEQKKLTFTRGERILITLLLHSNIGIMRFKRKLTEDILPSLRLKGFHSTSLSVVDADSELVIDTGHTLQERRIHEIELEFESPEVTSPTMMMIGGGVEKGGGGYWVVRGVVVDK